MRAAVDRGVGADLDVGADDDPADLRDLDPAPGVLGHAEAVGADRPRRCAGCSRGPITAAVVDADAACSSASAPIVAAGADRASRRRPSPVRRSPRRRRPRRPARRVADAATWAPGARPRRSDGLPALRRLADAGSARTRAYGRIGVGCEQLRRASSPRRAAGRRSPPWRASPASWLRYFGFARNAIDAGAGGSQRRHALDAHAAVAVDARAGQRGQLDERAARCGGGGWRHGDRAGGRRRRRYLSASALITFSVMSMRWLA